ncbi:MAG: hypothetical protein FMNOHCHN_01556 [Ignavibacteriaceae bacterium]|nr:hypothetical protein [Ignavibacteriaceae bacterium]
MRRRNSRSKLCIRISSGDCIVFTESVVNLRLLRSRDIQINKQFSIVHYSFLIIHYFSLLAVSRQ